MATLGVCRVDFRNWLKVGGVAAGTAVYYVQRGRHWRADDGISLIQNAG
ncbi:Putative S- transferase [Salmonella enterica subsp. enterica]|uniref:S- transferase n=1 Tax=Salmonella enterica I TaxID=59201 RepID=A0A3S4LW87_SALET|nr:Putative S- transferase [Salmonella enterica subsp. enterica]